MVDKWHELIAGMWNEIRVVATPLSSMHTNFKYAFRIVMNS